MTFTSWLLFAEEPLNESQRTKLRKLIRPFFTGDRERQNEIIGELQNARSAYRIVVYPGATGSRAQSREGRSFPRYTKDRLARIKKTSSKLLRLVHSVLEDQSETGRMGAWFLESTFQNLSAQGQEPASPDSLHELLVMLKQLDTAASVAKERFTKGRKGAPPRPERVLNNNVESVLVNYRPPGRRRQWMALREPVARILLEN